MKILYYKGRMVRFCDKCGYPMIESNSGWYCYKCKNEIRRKLLSRLRYMFGIFKRKY